MRVLVTAILLLAAVVAMAQAESTSVADGAEAQMATPPSADEGPPVEAQDAQDQDAEQVDPVPIQVWTVLAAGGAAAIGLVLFVLRAALGLVKPPPPQQEEEGQH